MVTISHLFPIAAKCQTETHFVQHKVGSQISAMPPVRVAPNTQTDSQFLQQKAGSPLTAIVPSLVSPGFGAEIVFVQQKTGSPQTVAVAFPHELTFHASVLFEQQKTGIFKTQTIAFRKEPHWHSSVLWQVDQAGASPVTTVILFPKTPSYFHSLLWKAEQKQFYNAEIHYRHDFRRFVSETIAFQYDWKGIVSTMLSYRHRSLVHAGWRILARNIETHEVTEIGFIDADSKTKELTDIELPDGVYEISVLTSSLFWKDAHDHKFVTITVCKDMETITLPMIYNLRSVVQLGTTHIKWSATQSDVTDCTFGLWFSESSSVDTQREPDQTVFYSSQMTEYSTTFSQRESCYVAIAAMRETETGKVHEMFLGWSTDKPPAPEDVIVFDKVLDVVDTPYREQAAEDANAALAF